MKRRCKDSTFIKKINLKNFKLFSYSATSVKQLKLAGFKVIVVTNQPDVGKKLLSKLTLNKMHNQLKKKTNVDKIYEASELASGENVVFAGSGITDGLLFHGVKFEKDCTRTSSLVISTLDNTARFTNTIHINDDAKSIALN